MADFDAPSGPPPPRVPEGWVARWNDQYKEWFYVNTYTKKSQWEKPTMPAVNPNDDSPAGPPPGYSPGPGAVPSDSKTNPFASSRSTPPNDDDADARLARQLQDEEDARARGPSRGAASDYMNTRPGGGPSPGPSSYPEDLPPREGGSGSRGLLGKIFGGGRSSNRPQYGGGGYPGNQGGYGGPPPQQYYGGGSPQPQGYYGGGPPPGAYGGGYGGGPAYGGGGGGGYGYGGGGYGGGGFQQQPQKKHGLGTAGGAALGLGAGLLGGALIEDVIDNHEQQAYDQGYDQGYDNGDNNQDFGGDDGGGFDGGNF
ncbi:hypothetical protein F5Y16DRAFT_403042 [Xylariaceae sp. FL0255]|nr:hypothetical protein F5Y16DRAFT_403042 [Xylariaceae sp. FL0255]